MNNSPKLPKPSKPCTLHPTLQDFGGGVNWKEKESPLQGACRELAEELFAQDETRINRVSVSLLGFVLIVVGSGAFLLGGGSGALGQ